MKEMGLNLGSVYTKVSNSSLKFKFLFFCNLLLNVVCGGFLLLLFAFFSIWKVVAFMKNRFGRPRFPWCCVRIFFHVLPYVRKLRCWNCWLQFSNWAVNFNQRCFLTWNSVNYFITIAITNCSCVAVGFNRESACIRHPYEKLCVHI